MAKQATLTMTAMEAAMLREALAQLASRTKNVTHKSEADRLRFRIIEAQDAAGI